MNVVTFYRDLETKITSIGKKKRKVVKHNTDRPRMA